MIEIEHLSKNYGNHQAVKDISFTVEDGHIYGFLGPNGAGKSTTMNMITGCLSMSEGSIKICGHDIFEEPIEAKKCIGYLPEIPPLYTDMTVAEYLYFVAAAKGISKDLAQQDVEKAVEAAALSDVYQRLIRNLSKGYRQRVGIAQAILGNPQIVILDEPTVGLDPKQIIEIRNLIKELGAKHTVILSSHILSEIQQVCDKVIVINEGRLVAQSDTDSIGEDIESYFLRLTEEESVAPEEADSDAEESDPDAILTGEIKMPEFNFTEEKEAE